MTHLQSRSHTIVIGGGLSGLAAATYLARGGSRVTVLEKSKSLGGRASTETPGGFALNRGAHALYTGGPATSVLRELGVSYSFGIPNRVFVRDERGMAPFPASAVGLMRASFLDAADKADLLRIFVRVGMMNPTNFGGVTAEDWISQTTRRPRLRKLLRSLARVNLYSRALDVASADTFVARFQQTIKHPVHYVDAGWQTIVDGLRAAAQAAGVHIQTCASVAELVAIHGRATGVRLHDHTVLNGDAVLIAATPGDAQHLLPSLPKTTAVQVACLDLALSRTPSTRSPVVFDLEAPRFVTTQSEFARVAPEGGAVVHAFYHLDPREAGDPDRECADLEKLMDKVQPGWRDVVVERRFLPRMEAAGWLPLAATGGLAGRPTNRLASLDNVYLAGDWIGPNGFLADAALGSAREAASLILQSQTSHAARDLVAA